MRCFTVFFERVYICPLGVTPGEEGIVAALEKEALDHILSVQNSDVYNSGPRPTAASLGIKESVDTCLEDDDDWEGLCLHVMFKQADS